ncbi:nucleotide exchange factor GrpE [Candidatus Woesearchaeota archaeon]|nr:MAG: nucleotide exchange factor GrpE [Candidatus Woesearchaeota archaeon]
MTKKKTTTAKTPKKEDEVNDLKETLQRVQADFENYKKRIEKENELIIERAKADLINKLLPIIDSFDLALTNKDKCEDFIKGIELIYAQFMDIMKKEGLEQIKALNEKFDPFKHEVLLQEESNKEKGTVLEELQKGYMFKDKVLRPTKVKISK